MTFQYVNRLFEEPKKSYFLFGPRGTGKSTLSRSLHPKALMIDLRLSDLKLKLAGNPQYLLEMVRAQPKGQVIIIDEIQKIPELLSLVHVLIEEKQGWVFILTGSSSRKLKRAGVDLLAGRALKKHLHPFMATELGEAFVLEDTLKYGLLPLRFDEENPTETLKTYVALYMEEEVKAEGIVRNIEPFARFLEAISFSHGGQLNLTNIARECMVKRTTVTSWVSILEDLLIAFQLQVFTKRAKRELSAHPKFYYFDAGVFRTIRPQSIDDPVSELDGPALEGLIAQHLLAWCDYTPGENNLTFWRTRSGVEVDFVLHSPLGFWAIEVKNTRNISLDDLRHLKIFQEDYPEAKLLFLYRGTDRLMKGNILCMPCSEFLSNLKPNQSIVKPY
ncbi:MAG: ATP-binding protein [Rhabdochlamydiaceae bacterium]|nr:ATP-binding protein [Rhabdochlamydiaceae bacterium]